MKLVPERCLPKVANRNIPALDGMRGVAALCVVGHHVGLIGGFPAGHGYLAVDFFFMLSGFVVTRAYERRFVSTVAALRFFVDRVKRLYPTIAVGLALGLVALTLGCIGSETLGWWVIPEAALIPVMAGGVLFPINDPLWSIFYELIVNLVHALLARWLNLAILTVVSLVAGACFVLFMISDPERGAGWGFEPALHSYEFGFARVAFSYFTGVIMCRLTAQLRPDGLRTSFPLLAVGLLFFLIGPRLGQRPLTDIVAIFVVFPVILFLGITSPVPSLIARPVRWLGAISFPIYATHFPILLMAAQVLPRHRLIAWVPVIILCAAVATAVEYRIDAPIRSRQKAARQAQVLQAIEREAVDQGARPIVP